jgi:protein Mpv17
MNLGVLRLWYGLLDRVFSASMNDLRVVLAKCASDQIVLAPFSICTYFGYTQLLNHGFRKETGPNIVAKIHSDLVSTWRMDCLVWPPANFICYRFVPLSYRPMFVGFVQLGWQLYLARVASREVKSPDRQGLRSDRSNS